MYDAYQGQCAFVTGQTGFKGSWLTAILSYFGADVYGYALNCKTAYDNFHTSNLSARIHDVRGDVTDYPALLSAMSAAQPTYVFHLAAQPLVRYSYVQPRETYMTNVMGTLNVLEAARATPSVQSVVVVTSDKCYANHEWCWGYRECDALGGYDPYSSSKACAEILTASYRQSFCAERPAIATARAGNVIGGGDWSADRIVPDCIRHLRRGTSILVRNPDAVRPWQHVLEPLFGYLRLAALLREDARRYEGAYNFGPDNSGIATVRDVVERIVHHHGSGTWHVERPADAPHEATLLSLDTSKARQMLGWRSVWDMDTAVAATIEWYKSVDEGDTYPICVSQIERYLSQSS